MLEWLILRLGPGLRLKRTKSPASCSRSSESPWPAPISNLIKQWIGSPCSSNTSTCGVLISFALYSKKACSLINPFDGMTVGTGQARTFCNDEISYGRSSGPDTSVQVSSLIAGHGIELFRLAKEKGLESIMAKRAASTYQAGRRSRPIGRRSRRGYNRGL